MKQNSFFIRMSSAFSLVKSFPHLSMQLLRRDANLRYSFYELSSTFYVFRIKSFMKSCTSFSTWLQSPFLCEAYVFFKLDVSFEARMKQLDWIVRKAFVYLFIYLFLSEKVTQVHLNLCTMPFQGWIANICFLLSNG